MTTASGTQFGLLRFQDAFFERIWGGRKLRDLYGMQAPDNMPIGEAWLIADHPVHESIVVDGPYRGKSLSQLLTLDAAALLGTRVKPTRHGRFPLLLKILDAANTLSVQVHPDDACAAQLGEPDVGKTEMWHVLQADPGAYLICGLATEANPDTFAQAMKNGTLESLMTRISITGEASVLVPAGAVHAIGAGLVLAEIQQNSDLTYRLYDWNRCDTEGKPRTLHIEKAMQAIHFGVRHPGLAKPLTYEFQDARREVLAACPYFATELITISNDYQVPESKESFHILLVKQGPLYISDQNTTFTLHPGNAILLPASSEKITITGTGAFLDYYVPDIERDILTPLLRNGYNREQIQALCG